MKTSFSILTWVIFLWVSFINGCTKDPSLDFEFPRNNPPPTVSTKPPPPYLLSGVIKESFTENFDGDYQLTGWQKTYHSEPHEPLADWQLGNTTSTKSISPPETPAVKPAYDRKFAYVGRTQEAACSKWLFTPPIYLKNGDTIPNSVNYLEVRLNERDSAIHIATDLQSVGRYTKLIGEIKNDYPKVWTQMKYVVSGFSSPTLSRVAFRYFIPEPKPGGGGIGIDNISFIKKR